MLRPIAPNSEPATPAASSSNPQAPTAPHKPVDQQPIPLEAATTISKNVNTAYVSSRPVPSRPAPSLPFPSHPIHRAMTNPSINQPSAMQAQDFLHRIVEVKSELPNQIPTFVKEAIADYPRDSQVNACVEIARQAPKVRQARDLIVKTLPEDARRALQTEEATRRQQSKTLSAGQRADTRVQYLDNTWGTRRSWMPEHLFQHPKPGQNFVLCMHAITSWAIDNGVDLPSLYSPGGLLHDAVHVDAKGVARLKIRDLQDLVKRLRGTSPDEEQNDAEDVEAQDNVEDVEAGRANSQHPQTPPPDESFSTQADTTGPRSPSFYDDDDVDLFDPANIDPALLRSSKFPRDLESDTNLHDTSDTSSAVFASRPASLAPIDDEVVTMTDVLSESPAAAPAAAPAAPPAAPPVVAPPAVPPAALPAVAPPVVAPAVAPPAAPPAALPAVAPSVAPPAAAPAALPAVPSAMPPDMNTARDVARQQLSTSGARLTGDTLWALTDALVAKSPFDKTIKVLDPVQIKVTKDEGMRGSTLPDLTGVNDIFAFVSHQSSEHWTLCHLRIYRSSDILIKVRHYDSIQSLPRDEAVRHGMASLLAIPFEGCMVDFQPMVSFSPPLGGLATDLGQPCASQRDATSCGIFAFVFLESLLQKKAVPRQIDPDVERKRLAGTIPAPRKRRISDAQPEGRSLRAHESVRALLNYLQDKLADERDILAATETMPGLEDKVRQLGETAALKTSLLGSATRDLEQKTRRRHLVAFTQSLEQSSQTHLEGCPDVQSIVESMRKDIITADGLNDMTLEGLDAEVAKAREAMNLAGAEEKAALATAARAASVLQNNKAFQLEQEAVKKAIKGVEEARPQGDEWASFQTFKEDEL